MRVSLAAEHVDRGTVSLGDGILDRGLEPARRVDHEARIPDRLDVARRELDIVRLGPGWREVHDLGSVGHDLLGRPGQRIEGRDDGVGVIVAARTSAAGNRDERDKEEDTHGSPS